MIDIWDQNGEDVNFGHMFASDVNAVDANFMNAWIGNLFTENTINIYDFNVERDFNVGGRLEVGGDANFVDIGVTGNAFLETIRGSQLYTYNDDFAIVPSGNENYFSSYDSDQNDWAGFTFQWSHVPEDDYLILSTEDGDLQIDIQHASVSGTGLVDIFSKLNVRKDSNFMGAGVASNIFLNEELFMETRKNIYFSDDGSIKETGSDLEISNLTNDEDIIFRGKEGFAEKDFTMDWSENTFDLDDGKLLTTGTVDTANAITRTSLKSYGYTELHSVGGVSNILRFYNRASSGEAGSWRYGYLDYDINNALLTMGNAGLTVDADSNLNQNLRDDADVNFANVGATNFFGNIKSSGDTNFSNVWSASGFFDSLYASDANFGSIQVSNSSFFDGNIYLENDEEISNATDGYITIKPSNTAQTGLEIGLDSAYFVDLQASRVSDNAARQVRMLGNLLFGDDVYNVFGNSTDYVCRWTKAETNDALKCSIQASGTTAQSGNIIYTEYDEIGYNFAFPAHLDPHVYITAGQANQETYLEMFHDKTNAVITTGETGDLNISIPNGNVRVEADMEVDGNILGDVPYAQSWYDAPGGDAISFDTANTWYEFDLSKNPTLNGFHVSDQSVVAEESGLYEFNYSAEGSGQNNHTYITTVAINDTNQDACISRKTLTAGGDIVPMSGGCFLNITAGDAIGLLVMDRAGTGAGTIYHYNLRGKRIGN